MALQVSSDAQLVFFNKVFGSTAATTNRVKALLSHGVTFEVSLYSIRAYSGSKTPLSVVQLTTGSTSLIKGTVDQMVALQNRKAIEQWVANLYQEQGAPAVVKPAPVVLPQTLVSVTALGLTDTDPKPNFISLIKAIREVTGDSLAVAKTKAESLLAGVDVAFGVYKTLEEAKIKTHQLQGLVKVALGGVEALKVSAVPHSVVGPYSWDKTKPVDKVIDLKDAAALGQKVHGTSTGSVYHTIALTDKVKVAARLYKSGSISIRAEWTDSPTEELKKLAEAGVQMKPTYGSIHFDAQDVPLQRVIGAFLVGTGIQWKAAVMNGAELVIGEK